MKHFLIPILLFVFCATGIAQKSIIKTNLGGWVITSANLTYEYQAGPNFAIGSSIAYMLPSTFDIDALAEQSDGDEFKWSGEIDIDGFAVSPFVRFYTKEAMQGFFIEVFARYYTYDVEIPYDYDKDGTYVQSTAVGDADGIGGGLAFGYQIYLGPNWVLDIYAGLGLASGSAHIETSDPNLDADDYAEIQQTIEENKDTDVEIFLLTNTINSVEPGADSNSAWADINNQAFPMLRAGVSFGYRF